VTANFRFGRFELNASTRQILLDRQPAPLGARAFDVLLALIERRDRLVPKNELLDLVWPGVVVEENNLMVQISALRKLLGADAIATIAGRGYRFSLTLDQEGLSGAPYPHEKPPVPLEEKTPSIAVLPFVNMSPDAENEYFADGLAEELANVLAKIRGLRVAARTSSFQFKGRNEDITVIGRKLNVATILEGSVRKAGNRVRITVQLVKVSDGYHLWSQAYDRTLEDIFAIQDDIAQSVVKELRATLLGEMADAKAVKEANAAVAAAVKGRSSNPEAHRLFLQARHLIDRLTREDTTKGIGYLKEALALEPEFALAWAELGRAYAIEADWGLAPVAEGYRRAREAVTHALALEPDLAEGHAAMGHLQVNYDWDWRGAEASYRRALELAPGNALVLHHAGVLAEIMGRFEDAIRLQRRAIEQDPLSEGAYFRLGSAFLSADRSAEAAAALRMAWELAPQRGITRGWLSVALLLQGCFEEALAEALREPNDVFRFLTLAIIHHAAGRRSEADAALQELIEKYANTAAYQVAEAYAARGAADLAFEWLERAYAQRDPGTAWTMVDTLLRSLHADSRWDPFLRKMGLTE
jgi:TolB-like protein/Tfp pilus assembly protein PilF